MTKYARKNQLNYAEMQRNKEQIVSGEEEKKNRIKTRSQSGRSMVEMLGVLAIIAILSIGGIVGYKLAMNYYQADQIANEINLMRNDLKVKYALGNEELILGDPYDDTPENEDYSGHLSTQYDRYPVDYDCIIRGNKESKNELYNCREADAYYIVVGNISKGVCKPLTTLVAAMDGRLEMDINGTPYTGGDSCTSDENNEIYVEFDAEDVNGNYDSNRPEGWCGKDGDCDTSRPICDIANNECVECTENADCSNNKPVCNIELGNCESCPPETPKWNGEECVECTTNTDCLAKGTENPICNTETNTCEPCPAETPLWYNNKCVECTTNANCFEKGTDEPVCNAENTCEPCPEGEAWNDEFKECVAISCKENSDCNTKGKNHYYCHFATTTSCSGQTGFGTCVDKDKNKVVIGQYVAKKSSMTRQSTKNFCAMHGKRMIKIADLDCAHNSSIDLTTRGFFYCHKDIAQDVKSSAEEDRSPLFETLYKALSIVSPTGPDRDWFFVDDSDPDSCFAYDIDLYSGKLSPYCGNDHSHFALCI